MESLDKTPPDPNEANATLSLLEQAWIIPRADVMRSVAGPALDEFIRPVYKSPLTSEEIDGLSEPEKTEDLPDFAESVIGILRRRLPRRILDDPRIPSEIDSLRESMYWLFFHLSAADIMQEGLESGVIIPLQVATQIQSMETGNLPNEEERDSSYNDSRLKAMPFDNAALRGILGRPSFGKILQRLTKGPGGFLGSRSTHNVSILSLDFYNFKNTNDGQPLKYWEAYDLEDGQVVDLNQAFHLSAYNQRKSRRGAQTSSSGCPVRHRFKDADTGEIRESLIDTSTKFLITALTAVSTRDRANQTKLPQNSGATS
jgi:hypothetical protein